MKQIFRSLLLAFAMFTRLPLPQLDWEQQNMRLILGVFPIIGVLMGGLLWAWGRLCIHLELPLFLYSIGMVLIPLVITGGIHMDGFADVTDALASHGSPEKKREILKDPHIGTFAVLGIVCAILLQVAIFQLLPPTHAYFPLLCIVPVASRVLSGVASLTFPMNGAQGSLSLFRESSARKKSLLLLGMIGLGTGAGLCILHFAGGLVCILLWTLCLGCGLRMSKKEFGGMNGDQAGYLLTVCELLLPAGLACMTLLR